MFVCVLLQIELNGAHMDFSVVHSDKWHQLIYVALAVYLFIKRRNGYCGCNYSCGFSCCWFDKVVAWICQAIKIVQVSKLIYCTLNELSYHFLMWPIEKASWVFFSRISIGYALPKFNWKRLSSKKINALTLNWIALSLVFFNLSNGNSVRDADGSEILEWSWINSKATWFVRSEFFKNLPYVSSFPVGILSGKQTTAKFFQNA